MSLMVEAKMKNTRFRLCVVIVLMGFLCDGRSASTHTNQSQPAQDTTDLVARAREGDLRAVESILATGVDVNTRSKDGETALAAAAGAYEGYDEVVDLLLNRGAGVDDRSLGHSAIWVDIAFGFCDEPMPSSSFRCGNSIFPMAEAYSKADKIGVTALLVAASAGHSKIVERLLAREAEVDARTFEGVTPLMLATISNDVQSMRLLLLKGASANAAAKKGQTALMLASWSDGEKIGARRIEAVKLLLDSGANLNAQDQGGRSALMGAAEANNLEAAKLLLSKGAEVNAKNQKGRTALMEAADAGNVEMLRLLLSKGADANAKDNSGRTALMEAASLHRKPEAVAVLIQAGAKE